MGIFKAYDIRGKYGEELSDETAYKIGKAAVEFLGCEKIAVGWDMRNSTPAIKRNFEKGVTEMGCDVLELGQVCSDAVYFASGKMGIPAVMITASHNPPEYNGLKFCRAGAKPLGLDSGLDEIKKLVDKNEFSPPAERGTIDKQDIMPEYVSHVRSFIDTGKLRKLKIAADAGNGMAGIIVPKVFEGLPVKIQPLYFELDGSFPNHPANPADYKNLEDLREKILEENCDFGMAFDGDADRIILVDEQGKIVDASHLSALIAQELLKKSPGEQIVYSIVSSDIVPETVEQSGGTAVLEKVGHSHIKKKMRETDAIFGCEASAHYYYRDHYYADSAMITALIVAEIVSREGKKMSELINPYAKYCKIEETNLKVNDKQGAIEKLKRHYENLSPQKITTIDGLRADFDSWWFCVRPSNTEPVLRLNLEAKVEGLMEDKKRELINLIKGKVL